MASHVLLHNEYTVCSSKKSRAVKLIIYLIIILGLMCISSYHFDTKVYAHRHDEITLSYLNYQENGKREEEPEYKDIIIVDTFVLIMFGHSYCDDAEDQDGDKFYFYMVDFVKDFKAYITLKYLEPEYSLDRDIQNYEGLQQFINEIKKNIERDGGIVKIISKLDKQ